ncbi:trehalose-phosphatase [Acinetobacter ihumii]|uniref:trehalose-phosphatase n=1 Tax=Acinetobacter ihumii TaxID=2483802 RepID=UPI00102FCB85|nr:trehalose-phosphatase [Acinetobacter ihumii]
MNINSQQPINSRLHDDYDHAKEILQRDDFIDQPIALFLDIDGTLADFNVDPEQCFISAEILNLIQHIQQNQGVVSVVTGRDLASAQRLLSSLELPIAALHGQEIYIDAHTHLSQQVDTDLFQSIYRYLAAEIEPYPDLSLENKINTVALHYRKCPELQPIAHELTQKINDQFPQLKRIDGKYVYELAAHHINKATAIDQIVSQLDLHHHLLIFIGDDRTDEDGFAYVNQHHGISIKVGSGQSIAQYRLEHIQQVTEFLKDLSQKYTQTSHHHPLEKCGEHYV